MGRFAVITLTDRAATASARSSTARDDAHGIRLGDQEGRLRRHGIHGRPGRPSPNTADDHVERDGAHVYVAPEAALFLLGTEMDFETDDAAHRLHLPQPEPEFRPAAAASRSN